MEKFLIRATVPLSARWAAVAMGFCAVTYIVYYGRRLGDAERCFEGLLDGTCHSSLVFVLWASAVVLLLALGVSTLRPRLLRPAALLSIYLVSGHVIASVLLDSVSLAFVLSNGAELTAAVWLLVATRNHLVPREG